MKSSGEFHKLVPETCPSIKELIPDAVALVLTLPGLLYQSYVALTPFAATVAVAPELWPVITSPTAKEVFEKKGPTTIEGTSSSNSKHLAYPFPETALLEETTISPAVKSPVTLVKIISIAWDLSWVLVVIRSCEILVVISLTKLS